MLPLPVALSLYGLAIAHRAYYGFHITPLPIGPKVPGIKDVRARRDANNLAEIIHNDQVSMDIRSYANGSKSVIPDITKSPRGRSLTSKPKTGGKNTYKPKQGAKCAPGYRLINGMCVRK